MKAKVQPRRGPAIEDAVRVDQGRSSSSGIARVRRRTPTPPRRIVSKRAPIELAAPTPPLKVRRAKVVEQSEPDEDEAEPDEAEPSEDNDEDDEEEAEATEATNDICAQCGDPILPHHKRYRHCKWHHECGLACKSKDRLLRSKPEVRRVRFDDRTFNAWESMGAYCTHWFVVYISIIVIHRKNIYTI
jgi:hypothetical protein